MVFRFPAFAARSRVAVTLAAGLLVTGLAWSRPQAQEPATGSTPPEPASQVDTTPRPLLKVVDREIDLGTLYRGEQAEARFELRNVGNADLHIQRVKPG